MSKTSLGLSKRLGIGLLAASLGVFGIAFASPAVATADVTTDRVAGVNRYGTAAAVATEAYPDGNDTVIIATGETFPDALAASGLAGHLDAPVLLTMTASLSEEAEIAIEELGATNATIIGGTAAVAPAVQDALEDDGVTVDRVAGDDRYATAAEAADEIGTYTRAIVASGEVGADALSSGPIAADQEDGPSPILLVTQDDVPTETDAALDGVAEVVIVGGTARISDTTADEIEAASADADAERVAGQDRQETAGDIAEWAVDNLGWAPTTVLLAAPSSPSDDFSPDALVAGPLGGLRDAPVLIIDAPCTLGGDPTGFLNAHADTVAEIIAVGGTAVICDDVVDDAADEAGFEDEVPVDSNQSFTGTGGGLAFMDSDDTDASATTYSFDVGDAEMVSIMLLPCDNVTTDEDGVVSFLDEDGVDEAGNDRADGKGTTGADIEVVNGVSNNDDDGYVEDVAPNNGVVTFSINTEDAGTGCVVPVVFEDTNGNNQLDLDENNQPTEPFGVGPSTTFIPPEADSGLFDVLVAEVDKDANGFVGFDDDDFTVETFFYDANDDFELDEVPISMATFEAELSKADSIDGTYAEDPEARSTFNLYDDEPEGVTLDTTENDGNDVTVEVFYEHLDGDHFALDGALFDDEDLVRIFRAEFDPADFDEDDCDDVDFIEFGESFDTDSTDDYELIFEGTEADDEGEEEDSTFEYEDEDVPAGCYVYTATVVIDGDESDPAQSEDDFEDVREDIGTTEAVAPLIIDADLDEVAGTPAVIDETDIIELQFNETMDTEDIEDDGVIRFTDPDGEVFQVACGGVQAVCEFITGDANADDDEDDEIDEDSLLIIELLEEPTKVGGPGDEDGFAQVPSTITELSSQFDDLSGNQVDLANSPDRVIENELG